MLNQLKSRSVWAALLAATIAATMTLPAAARDGNRRDRDDEGRAIARGVGSIIIGAIGAAESRRRYRGERTYGYTSEYGNHRDRRGYSFNRRMREGH